MLIRLLLLCTLEQLIVNIYEVLILSQYLSGADREMTCQSFKHKHFSLRASFLALSVDISISTAIYKNLKFLLTFLIVCILLHKSIHLEISYISPTTTARREVVNNQRLVDNFDFADS